MVTMRSRCCCVIRTSGSYFGKLKGKGKGIGGGGEKRKGGKGERGEKGGKGGKGRRRKGNSL